MRWPGTLRARLTLWYTLILGLPLIAFAVGSYVVLARTLMARSDHFVSDALLAFRLELVAEQREQPTTMGAIRVGLDELSFRDLRIVVLDSADSVVARGAGPYTFVGETRPAPRDSSPNVGVSDWDELPAFDLTRMLDSLRNHPVHDRVSFTLPNAAGGFRVLAQLAAVNGTPFRVVGIYSLRELHEILARFRGVYLVAVPILLVLAAAGGYLLTNQSLSPLTMMSARATAISASNLHERLPVASPHDELGKLATVINRLLDRLDIAFGQQRRFMADASHELRTPVAILRSEADVTLSREHRDESSYRESIGVMQDAAHRLGRIVDDLFLIARADAGSIVVRRDDIYLDDVVLGAVRGVRQIADSRGVHIEVASLDEAPMRGDADLLGRLILNLLDNAIKFTPSGGRVTLSLAHRADAHELSVVDSGPGIPSDAQDRIFERFFRVDAARSRTDSLTTSGAGLGLAIARWVADAHEGRLELASSVPGRSEFRVSLPAILAAAAVSVEVG